MRLMQPKEWKENFQGNFLQEATVYTGQGLFSIPSASATTGGTQLILWKLRHGQHSHSWAPSILAWFNLLEWEFWEETGREAGTESNYFVFVASAIAAILLFQISPAAAPAQGSVWLEDLSSIFNLVPAFLFTFEQRHWLWERCSQHGRLQGRGKKGLVARNQAWVLPPRS